MSKSKAKVICVIPARYSSTRLPGKALADIEGQPMIWRVVERVRQAKNVRNILVATDSREILKAVKKRGGDALLTSEHHLSGTDRIAEAVRLPDYDLVLNVQGDEPLINPDLIDALIDFHTTHNYPVTTACHEISMLKDIENPNNVKVVFDNNQKALYFSRSVLPYNRNKDFYCKTYKHIGIYLYNKDFLLNFTSWPPGILEQKESLEQLRILEKGYSIGVMQTKYSTPGVDTPEDLEEVRKLFKKGVGENVFPPA